MKSLNIMLERPGRGGYTNESDPLPEQAVMMAQHFHRAGYQTAVFTTNANAGSLSDFQRTVDVFRDRMAKNQSRGNQTEYVRRLIDEAMEKEKEERQKAKIEKEA